MRLNLGTQGAARQCIGNSTKGRKMNVCANITIQEISNGFVLSDGYNGNALGMGGESESETRFYGSLDELAADAGRFVREAVENQRARLHQYEEQRKAEQAHWEKQAKAEANQVNIRFPAPGSIA